MTNYSNVFQNMGQLTNHKATHVTHGRVLGPPRDMYLWNLARRCEGNPECPGKCVANLCGNNLHVVKRWADIFSTSDFDNIGCNNIYEKHLEIRNSTSPLNC